MSRFNIAAMFLNAGVGFYNGIIGDYSTGTFFIASAVCIYMIGEAVK
jgi:hypothetical protein